MDIQTCSTTTSRWWSIVSNEASHAAFRVVLHHNPERPYSPNLVEVNSAKLDFHFTKFSEVPAREYLFNIVHQPDDSY